MSESDASTLIKIDRLTKRFGTFTALDAAFTELAGATPQIRRRVLEAAARTAATDGIIRAAEAELLRAFADALGCPAPLFPDPAQPA